MVFGLETSAVGLENYRPTPVGVQMPGVEIHAQIAESIFDGRNLAETLVPLACGTRRNSSCWSRHRADCTQAWCGIFRDNGVHHGDPAFGHHLVVLRETKRILIGRNLPYFDNAGLVRFGGHCKLHS